MNFSQIFSTVIAIIVVQNFYCGTGTELTDYCLEKLQIAIVFPAYSIEKSAYFFTEHLHPILGDNDLNSCVHLILLPHAMQCEEKNAKNCELNREFQQAFYCVEQFLNHTDYYNFVLEIMNFIQSNGRHAAEGAILILTTILNHAYEALSETYKEILEKCLYMEFPSTIFNITQKIANVQTNNNKRIKANEIGVFFKTNSMNWTRDDNAVQHFGKTLEKYLGLANGIIITITPEEKYDELINLTDEEKRSFYPYILWGRA